jgi:hypothetical protein
MHFGKLGIWWTKLGIFHKHNGLAILISRESWNPCRTRTPHVAVVSRETTPPRAQLFFFPRAPPPFFARGRRRSIVVFFSCSDARLPGADVAALDQAATSFGDLEALLAEALRPGWRGATWDCCLDWISTTWTKRWRGLARWTRPRDVRENWWRRVKELRATGEWIAREKESARATRERISHKDERFLDKNS